MARPAKKKPVGRPAKSSRVKRKALSCRVAPETLRFLKKQQRKNLGLGQILDKLCIDAGLESNHDESISENLNVEHSDIGN